MRIEKICKDNETSRIFEGCKCIECLKRDAEFALHVSGHMTQLCADCIWDLKDMIDETTLTNFLSITRNTETTDSSRAEFNVVFRPAEDSECP